MSTPPTRDPREEDGGLDLPMPKAPPMSPSLQSAMQKLQPVRTRRPLLAFVAVAALSLAWMAGIVLLRPHRADLPYLPQLWWLLVGAAWLGGFLAPLALALLPRRGTVLPDGARALAAALITIVGLLIVAVALTPAAPETRIPATTSDGVHWTLHCLGRGLAFASVPLVATLIALRRLLLVGSARLVAAAGAAAGALGGLTLHVLCPVGGAMHVGCGHAGAVVISALAGGAIGFLVERAR